MKLIKLTKKYNGRSVYVDPNTVCMVSESEPIDGISENPGRSWIVTTYKEIIEVTETAEEVARMVQESTETRENPMTLAELQATIETGHSEETARFVDKCVLETLRKMMAEEENNPEPNNP